MNATSCYHPDEAINAEVAADALEAERFDLSIGYPPRAWTCPCGVTHRRGHFGVVGIHRCLSCGYVGTAGVMHSSRPCSVLHTRREDVGDTGGES